jgi:5-methylcytosine-specific restriction endonuclease McrA
MFYTFRVGYRLRRWDGTRSARRCRVVREAPGDPFRGLRRSDRGTWPTGLCARCGRAFARSQESHVYCSARCRSASSVARRREPAPLVHCDRCGAEFTRKRLNGRYCSRRCRESAGNMRAYRNDPERARQRWRDWYRKNRENVIAYVREWKQANPDRRSIYERRRRAARFGGSGTHSIDEVLALFEAYEWRCAYCGSGEELTIDHRVPLSRGGGDSIENLIPACGSCNSSKHDRPELSFRADRALEEFIRGRALAPGARMSGRGAARHRAGGPC